MSMNFIANLLANTFLSVCQHSRFKMQLSSFIQGHELVRHDDARKLDVPYLHVDVGWVPCADASAATASGRLEASPVANRDEQDQTMNSQLE